MANQQDFDSLFARVIDEVLSGLFGSATAKAVKFYLDPQIAIKDADEYSQLLERMFGEGSKIIVNQVMQKLCERAGVEKKDWLSLGECAKAFKDRLIPSGK